MFAFIATYIIMYCCKNNPQFGDLSDWLIDWLIEVWTDTLHLQHPWHQKDLVVV